MAFCNNRLKLKFRRNTLLFKRKSYYMREVNLIFIYCSEHQDLPFFAESKFTL